MVLSPHPAAGCVTPGPSGSPLTAPSYGAGKYCCAAKCARHRVEQCTAHTRTPAARPMPTFSSMGTSSKPYPRLLLAASQPDSSDLLWFKVELLESSIGWKPTKSSLLPEEGCQQKVLGYPLVQGRPEQSGARSQDRVALKDKTCALPAAATLPPITSCIHVSLQIGRLRNYTGCTGCICRTLCWLR